MPTFSASDRSARAAAAGPPHGRRGTLARERVAALLDCALDHPLTIVSAPAGYGKTTALAGWCADVAGDCAWVSLAPRDDDPRRLCARLLAAIDRLAPAAAEAAPRALQDDSEQLEVALQRALAALAERDVARPLTLVLDDYDALTADRCHDLVIWLLDALPPALHLVIAGRAGPPLRVARRRADHAVAELGAAELAFDLPEAERLLNGTLQLRLSREQVERLHTRVEGWPAGLSLAAASLRAARDAERAIDALRQVPGAIADYLDEEVLHPLPARTRAFLRRTALLSRMDGAFCAAVLDDPIAGQLLADVRRANLFVVPAADAPHDGWVRYHRLFATLLERELRREEPAAIGRLHLRASAWLEREGLVAEAIDHAAAAGDDERVERLLRAGWWQLLAERRYDAIRRTIARLRRPDGRLAPLWVAVELLCMSLTGADLRLVAERLDALERHRDEPDVAEALDIMRISPYYGDVGRALSEGRRIWRERAGDMRARSRHAGKLALVMWFAGERTALRDEVEPYMGVVDRPVLRSWEQAALSLIAADEGDIDAAERHAFAAVAAAEAAGGEMALESHLAHVALAEALRRRGRFVEALAQIGRAMHTTGRHPGSVYHALVLVIRAQLDLSMRDRRAARAHAAAARRIVDRYRDVGVLADRLAAVEAALAPSRHSAAPDSEPTAAEWRVLRLLPTDLTRRQIADELGLSVATVKSHIWRLYRRLGTTTRAEAVAIARERGLM